jgi:hypothetical protein
MAFAFPSVGVNTGALRPGVLQRISLYRGGSASTAALDIAPIVKVATRQGAYHWFSENDALVTDGAQGIQPVNYDTPAVAGGLRISSSNYASSLFRWGFNIFTLKQIEEFAARAEDITAVMANRLSHQGVQHHAAVVGAALSASGNYGSTLAVTGGGTAAANLQQTFNSLLLASAADGADITEGRWVAVCNLNTANVLLQKNEVQQMGYAIAAATVGGALAQARTGAADFGQLAAFFQTKLITPVEFVCLPHYLPTAASQTGTPVITDGIVSIFKVAETYGASGFLQTFTPDPNAALGQIISYNVDNPRGIAMYVESDYGIIPLGGTPGTAANKWARLATGLS